MVYRMDIDMECQTWHHSNISTRGKASFFFYNMHILLNSYVMSACS